MAKSWAVALYTLSVTKRDKEKTPESLSAMTFDGHKFYDFVEAFLDKYKDEIYQDAKNDSYLMINKLEKVSKKPFNFDGKVESGENGFETRLYHTETKKNRKRQTKEAELLPYYFCVRQTTDPNLAVLCLQRIGGVGIKTVFIKAFREAFNEKFPKHFLDIKDHLPDFYTKKFFKSNTVKRVEYTYMMPISDSASALQNNDERKAGNGEIMVKISVLPAKGSTLSFRGKISSIGDSLSKLKPKFGISEDRRKDTSVTLTNASGQSRTFSIAQNKDVLPYIDITSECGKGTDGHPVFEDVRSAVEDILKEAKLIS